MPYRAEWKTIAHDAPSRTEDPHTYQRLHQTGRKTAAHEGSLPRIPQATPGRKEDDNNDATPGRKEDDNNDATPGRKEDDNHDAMLGMKKDDNHDATLRMKEDKHDE